MTDERRIIDTLAPMMERLACGLPLPADLAWVRGMAECLRSIREDRAVWTGLSGLNGDQRATINQLLK